MLDDLEHRIRDRARRHRQEVTVHLPRGHSPQDAATTVQAVRAITPDEVDVTVRHYDPPR